MSNVDLINQTIIIIILLQKLRCEGKVGIFWRQMVWCFGMHIEVARYNISLTLNPTCTVCDIFTSYMVLTVIKIFILFAASISSLLPSRYYQWVCCKYHDKNKNIHTLWISCTPISESDMPHKIGFWPDCKESHLYSFSSTKL